jgi:AAHS family benzoate transporter-like MFS transporter
MSINQTNFEQPNEKQVDKIFSKYGYGSITWELFLIVFLVISLEGFHVTFFGNVMIPLKGYYNMTEQQMQLISSTFFLSLAIGSLFIGFLTDKFKRSHILLTAEFLICAFHLAIGLVNDLIAFTILRLCIGVCIGIIVPLSINLLTEYLPIQSRSLFLTASWMGITPGQIYILVIMIIVMPQMQIENFRNTLLISTTWSFITFIITLLFVRESPRYLLLHNKNEEAFQILEEIKAEKLSDYEKEIIIKENKENVELGASFKDLFQKDLLLTTVLSIFIWLISSVLQFGPQLISTLTMKQIGIDEENLSYREIIFKQIVIVLLMTPANIIGGYVSELPAFGRKRTIMISFLIAVVFIILMIVDNHNYHYYFGVYLLFVDLSYDVNTTYSCELYPTRVRDKALGFLFFCNRIGGFISQILFIYFDQLGTWNPYYACILLLVINIVLVLFLPIETLGRALDVQTDSYQTFQDEEKCDLRKIN